MAEHRIIQGDCVEVLRTLRSESVHCCVTSPPYFGLRDYGTASWNISNAENAEIAEKCDHKTEAWADDSGDLGERGSVLSANGAKSIKRSKGQCRKCGAVRIDNQIGLEATPQAFIAKMVEVFEEVRRVLRKDGVCFVNFGDSYCHDRLASPMKGDYSGDDGLYQRKADVIGLMPKRSGDGLKPKDLMLMPHRVAIALQDAGWWVRSDIPWVKRSAMPESVTDRPAKALEYVFMLTKSPRYYFDMQAVRVSSAWDASNTKFPDGWDTTIGNGNHGSFNKDGRSKGERNDATQPSNWKGSSFSKGKTAEHQLNRSQKDRDRSFPSSRNGITEHLDQTPAGSRNFRNADLWFQSIDGPHGLVGVGDELVGLDVNPSGFKEAHFATFPAKLIEPLIKAATSEKGCCKDCGAPWERSVDVSYTNPGNRSTNGSRSSERKHIEYGSAGYEQRLEKQTTTTGWQPACKCKDAGGDACAPVACTVLDPFAGAGTTMLVSKRLGRDSIGIELNPEYIEIAERRLEHWHKPQPPAKETTESLGPLFENITEAAANG